MSGDQSKVHAYRAPGARWLRTDVRYMRRRELFRSSGEFLIVGAACLALIIAIASVPFTLGAWGRARAVVSAVSFGLVIFTGMGIAGSIYLMLRGLLRSSSYDPDAVWRADQAKLAEREAGSDSPQQTDDAGARKP